MKIGVAQIRIDSLNLSGSLAAHEELIVLAHDAGTDSIFFPELSVTGYVLSTGQHLAENEKTVAEHFQHLSDVLRININVGFPIERNNVLFIALLIFQPGKKQQTYVKQHLFPGEEKFFSPGISSAILTIGNYRVAPAICHELNVAEHVETAFNSGADVYVATVVNSLSGFQKDFLRLSTIAVTYQKPVMMSNFIGQSGNYECCGNSCIFDPKGSCLDTLDGDEGVLVYDLDKRSIEKRILQRRAVKS